MRLRDLAILPLWATLPVSLMPGVAAAEVTVHEDPGTGLRTWTARETGLTLELIQLLPDFVRAVYGKKGFPREQVEDIASYCVFGTILKNAGTGRLQYRVSEWRYLDGEGEHPVRTKTEWLEQWHRARVNFAWTLLPDEGDFAYGDWQQGFTTIKTRRDEPFTLIYTWRVDGVPHTARLEGLRCAPQVPER